MFIFPRNSGTSTARPKFRLSTYRCVTTDFRRQCRNDVTSDTDTIFEPHAATEPNWAEPGRAGRSPGQTSSLNRAAPSIHGRNPPLATFQQTCFGGNTRLRFRESSVGHKHQTGPMFRVSDEHSKSTISNAFSIGSAKIPVYQHMPIRCHPSLLPRCLPPMIPSYRSMMMMMMMMTPSPYGLIVWLNHTIM